MSAPGFLAPGRLRVMGIVNVTPDSFSDGGKWLTPTSAVTHALELVAQGADLIDVGGESTRPGAVRPSLEVELQRVIPVVAELAARGVVVSVDTMRAQVAEAAVAAGAQLINDVSGGLADPDMLTAVADLGAAYVTMHWRGQADVMMSRASYGDVVSDVCAELGERVEAARSAGIARERLVVDPGIGFAKTAEDNWALLRHLDAVSALGHPVLLGVSRKSFIGALLATANGPRPPQQRDDASAAFTALAALHRLWAVRTHTARAHRDVAEVFHRLNGQGAGSEAR